MEERDKYRYRLHASQRAKQEEEAKKVRAEHRLLLLRWLTAGMLFLVLAAAFYFDFSYHGFDKEYVEGWLQDDRLWKMAVQEIRHYLRALEAMIS